MRCSLDELMRAIPARSVNESERDRTDSTSPCKNDAEDGARRIAGYSWSKTHAKNLAPHVRLIWASTSELAYSISATTRPMARQNRVTPFGDIVAIPQRGMFTGNRGIIHDPATKTLLRKRWSSKAWIICTLSYKDVRRDVMATRSWTELFFLDEAVALAAGHRPCFACRRESANAFRSAWSAGKRMHKPAACSMDGTLHQERLRDGIKRIHPLSTSVKALPDGAVVAIAGEAFTLASGLAFRWTENGYAPPIEIHKADGLVTPPSTIQTITAGYRPSLHPSIASFHFQ